MAYLKLVTKLKYNDKPNYEKCRSVFMDGLKSLGKANSGEIEFKTTVSTSAAAKKGAAAVGPVKAQRAKAGRSSTKTAPKPSDNVENISPKPKNSRKRETVNESPEDSESPSKKSRTTKTSTQGRSTKTSTANSSVVVNKPGNDGKKNKTYNINLDLDISFDANVIVSVKRKNKKVPKDADVSLNQSIQSTDEIPATDKSFIVHKKVYKRAARSSPRTK